MSWVGSGTKSRENRFETFRRISVVGRLVENWLIENWLVENWLVENWRIGCLRLKIKAILVTILGTTSHSARIGARFWSYRNSSSSSNEPKIPSSSPRPSHHPPSCPRFERGAWHPGPLSVQRSRSRNEKRRLVLCGI